MHPLCHDSGLYVPEIIPTLPRAFFDNMNEMTLRDISYVVARAFLSENIEAGKIKEIIDHALSFDIPLVKFDDNLYSLELFNGPSATFKDIAMRFISAIYGHEITHARSGSKPIVALLATAGDSGAAMAMGLKETKGTKVIILFPQGKINHIQREQLATAGDSVTAVEVRGSFDQCQRLVMETLADSELRPFADITSINSLNILRLLPQMFHYFHAVASVMRDTPGTTAVSFALPGGNMGNLTAGIMAKRMGLPIDKFYVGVNANSPLPEYLRSGTYMTIEPTSTITGAIDVVNPTNFKRLEYMFNNNYRLMAQEIKATLCSNTETIFNQMSECLSKYGYLTDPHTAIAYYAAKSNAISGHKTVMLATSHPAKSPEAVFNATGVYPPIPPSIAAVADKKVRVTKISPRYPALKNLILKIINNNS